MKVSKKAGKRSIIANFILRNELDKFADLTNDEVDLQSNTINESKNNEKIDE